MLVSTPKLRTLLCLFYVATVPLQVSGGLIKSLNIYPDGTVVRQTIWDSDGSTPPPDVPPLNIDCASLPGICSNICYYENCKGHPPPKGAELHPSPISIPAPGCLAPDGHQSKCNVGGRLGTACYSYPPPPTTEAAVDGGVGVATRCVDVQEVGTAAYLFNQLKYWKEIETVLNNTDAPGVLYCDDSCDRSGDDGQQT